MAKKTVATKKRVVKVDANGQLHVHSSFNNITIQLATGIIPFFSSEDGSHCEAAE